MSELIKTNKMKLRFTQKIKDNWLKALKSGDYNKNQAGLINKDRTRHCCLAVLSEIHQEAEFPYKFLNNTIGVQITGDLCEANDVKNPISKDGYEESIALIEKLPVTK